MRILIILISLLVLNDLNIQAQVPAPLPVQHSSVLIVGGIAHLGDGRVIENSAIGFKDGYLNLVQDQMKGRVAVSTYDTVIRLNGQHVYPGFILPNTTLGVTEIDALRQTRDFKDVGMFNPNLRTATSINMDSEVMYTVRSNGVLVSQATPRGGIVSGTSSIYQMNGWNWEDALLKTDDGVHLYWPSRFSAGGPWYHKKNFEMKENQDSLILELESFFHDARVYSGASDVPVNLRLKAMTGVFDGSQKLFVHANLAYDMLRIIQFKKEFDIPDLVIVGGYEAYKIPDQLRESNIPIILRRVHSLPLKPQDDIHLPYKLPAMLHEMGIKFCLDMSGDMEAMNGRNLPFLAGEAVGYGLPYEQAVRTITGSTAEILGIDERVGILATGKEATLIISSGDALDMRTNDIIMAWIKGQPIDLSNHQKELYEKYKKRYEGTKSN